VDFLLLRVPYKHGCCRLPSPNLAILYEKLCLCGNRRVFDMMAQTSNCAALRDGEVASEGDKMR